MPWLACKPFGDIHSVSRNCDTNACINFIFDVATDMTIEWRSSVDFGKKSEKPKWPPAAIL